LHGSERFAVKPVFTIKYAVVIGLGYPNVGAQKMWVITDRIRFSEYQHILTFYCSNHVTKQLIRVPKVFQKEKNSRLTAVFFFLLLQYQRTGNCVCMEWF